MRTKGGDKTRRLTLKQKVLYPYVVLIILVSLTVLVVFNFAIRIYFNRMALQEMESTHETVLMLLRKELTSMSSESGIASEVRPLITALNSALRLTAKTSGSEVVLLGAKGNVLMPKAVDLSSGLSATLTDVADRIRNQQSEGILRVTHKGERFIVSFEALQLPRGDLKQQYLVIAHSQGANDLMVRRINTLLIGILVLASGVGLIIARQMAIKLTQPITAVSLYAKSISSGDYTTPKGDPGSQEMEALYRDLTEMSQELQKKEQSKIDFLQNFSHDLRTPLMSIQGYAEGIVTGVFQDPIKPATIIASESLRLKHLVEQILTLSRLDTVNQPIVSETLDLSQSLNTLVERYEGMATQGQKKILCHCETALMVKTDEQLLEKILGNLLSNAIHYALEVVQIRAFKENDSVVIEIQDDGPGIPEDRIPQLFKRFYKGINGNFGLGLAIAMTATELLKGRLTGENKRPGALFRLTLGQL